MPPKKGILFWITSPGPTGRDGNEPVRLDKYSWIYPTCKTDPFNQLLPATLCFKKNLGILASRKINSKNVSREFSCFRSHERLRTFTSKPTTTSRFGHSKILLESEINSGLTKQVLPQPFQPYGQVRQQNRHKVYGIPPHDVA